MIEPFIERFTNLISQIHNLVNEIFPNQDLKIGYLTVFAQSKDSYNSFRSVLSKYGNECEANNGFKYVLDKPLDILGEHIEVIRVRNPDVHRTELGCCDLIYKEGDYDFYRDKALETGLDIILRKGYEMIELSTPDIPVYAYMVKETQLVK